MSIILIVGLIVAAEIVALIGVILRLMPEETAWLSAAFLIIAAVGIAGWRNLKLRNKKP